LQGVLRSRFVRGQWPQLSPVPGRNKGFAMNNAQRNEGALFFVAQVVFQEMRECRIGIGLRGQIVNQQC
jgi:hypothetical protein